MALPAPISLIVAGTGDSLAATTDGPVYAWGDDTSGELGNGENTQIPGPVLLP